MTLRAFALPIGIAALASLPVQAQTPPGAFNPMTYLAPMMTPFGIIMAPVTNPGAGGFNPMAMMNPANLAAMPNPQALMPGLPAGMQPFTGLQMPPQAYGMPPQMANPYAGMMPFSLPLPLPAPAPAPNAGFPSLPFPFFPPAR